MWNRSLRAAGKERQSLASGSAEPGLDFLAAPVVDVLDNKYQVEQLLGKGGMGAVYRATHLRTKRTVAVKVIHPQLSAYDQFVAPFRREAKAAGRLATPHKRTYC